MNILLLLLRKACYLWIVWYEFSLLCTEELHYFTGCLPHCGCRMEEIKGERVDEQRPISKQVIDRNVLKIQKHHYIPT